MGSIFSIHRSEILFELLETRYTSRNSNTEASSAFCHTNYKKYTNSFTWKWTIKRMRVAIIGATSSLAHETAKCFAKDGAELFLVARNAEKLQAVADDLKVRGAPRVETYVLDLNEFDQ